jgi:hypothetical protein
MGCGRSTALQGARFAALVAGVVAVGCAAWAAAPGSVALGERFELGAGESARIEGEDVAIELDRVVADSRCAVGVTCVWEGDAVVRVRLRVGSQPAVALELHTAARAGSAAAGAHGYRVRLVGLEPHPVEGRATPPEAYRAALEVTRGAGENER